MSYDEIEKLKKIATGLESEIQEEQAKLTVHLKKLTEAKRLSTLSFHGLNDWHSRSCYRRMVDGLEKQKIPLETKLNDLCSNKNIIEAKIQTLENQLKHEESIIIEKNTPNDSISKIELNN